MSTIKQSISLLLVLCLLLSAVPVTAHAVTASGTCGDNLTWTLSEDGVLTISGTGPMTDYTSTYDLPWDSSRDSISSVIIENGVTTIGNLAFLGCVSLSSVTIPDSVTTIGDSAFNFCESLSSVEIPDSVTTIRSFAFSYCDSLSGVEIPNSVTTIGDSAFSHCDSLSGIYVDTNNLSYSNDDRGVLFDKHKTNLIQAPGAIGGSYTIPNSVTTIDNGALAFCANLNSAEIPNSVTFIGDRAFWECDSLSSVVIPDSVTTIGEYAFEGCDSLSSVVIPDSVTTIDYRTFSDCTSLSSVVIGNSVTTIGRDAFRGCTSLNSVVIPNNVTAIWYQAFMDCTSLSNVVIPNSVTHIGVGAFWGCKSLSSVVIPNSVTHIEDHIFMDCTSLSSVVIPNSVTAIWSDAFYNCDSLSSVEIPDSVTYIGGSAFACCDSLSGIYVDTNNLSYSNDDRGVLFDKHKTELIQAPGAIGGSYTIPNSVTTIGVCAFEGCASLSSVVIPDSVTTISGIAFYSCDILGNVVFQGDAPSIALNAFSDVIATAYYPADNPTWITDVMQDYGGTITWVPDNMAVERDTSIYDYFDDTMIRITPLELDSLWSLFAPLTGVTLSSWNEEVILTEGEYFIRRADASSQDVVLSKDGYRDYILPTEVAKTMREKDGIAYALTAYMQKDTKDGKPYISTVFGRESGSDNTYADLRVTDLSVKEDSGSDIIVTAAGFDNQKVTYYLAQDSIHKISSSNGLFPNEWLYDIFDDTSTVYAYAVGSDGTQTEPLAIRIKREEPFELAKELLDDSEWSFFGKDCFKITLSDDIPLLGGTELDISAFTFPVGISLEGDEMKISLGTDWFSSTEDADGYKWKAFKDLVIKQEEVNTETIDAFFKDYKKNYGENWKKIKKANKFNANVLGFVEGKWINGEFVIKEGQINLGGNFKFQWNAQGAWAGVPVYGTVEAGADFNAGGKVNRFLPDRDIPFEFTMLLNVAPKVKGGAGAGIKDAASAGLYAEGKMPLMIAFQEEHVKLDLHGEIGVEGELFLLHGRKALIEGDTNLIDWYYGTYDSPSAVSRVPVQNQTTTTVVSRDYAENTSAWLGGRGPALSIQSVGTKTTASRGVTFRELQNSIFSNSQPQLVTVGDRMLLVWVQDDATRDTYNRMRLVYSVYDSLCDSWSEPQPVWDDGHNDGYPMLASDGNQAYVLWQKINTTLTADNTTDVDTTIENSELCMARFDANAGTFADAQMLTDNVLYEYAHNVVLEKGEPMVYWAAAEANAMDTPKVNKLYCWINGTESVLARNLNYVISIDASYGEVTYVADTDGDLSSVEDVTATTISDSGTEVFDNSELGTAVTYAGYAPFDGEAVLFLSDMRNIYYNHNGEVKSVLEESRAMDGNLNIVETDQGTTITWTETVDGWNEIYAVRYEDGKWSAPVMISESGKLLTKISATGYDGKLFGVCNANAVTYDEAAGDYVMGETNLMLFQASAFSDIALANYLNINENELEAGVETTFNVTVYNNGTKSVDEVTFTITDTLGTEAVQTVAVDIPSGGSETVALTYLVPDSYITTTLSVTAAIADADVDVSDNSMSRPIGNPDLTVTETAVEILNDGYKIMAVVQNGSLVDAENVTLSAFADEDYADLLLSETIGTISRENFAIAEVLVKEGALSYSENGTAKIYLRMDADGDEASSADNTICVVVSETEDTICMHPVTEMVARLEATCTESGYEAYEICTGCKEAMEEFTVIPARGHNHTASTTQPTCTEQGYTTYTCECGDSYVAEYTDALGHDYEDGICTRCGTEDPYADVPAGVQFEIYDDHVKITGYDGDAAEIVIPAMIDGLPVTEIGVRAFEYCTSLTSISIPDGVVEIGTYAFYGCSNLSNFEIPDSVRDISWGAFAHCTSLTSITIPNSVTDIDYELFYGCTSLTSVEIPDSVTYIGNYAFYDCSSLTSIDIPDNVNGIGEYVFYGCSSLTGIHIPDSVTDIGEYAFSGCSSLGSIFIHDELTNIGWGAFSYCSGLTEFVVDEDNPNYSVDARGVLFSKDKTELIQAPGAIMGSYHVPYSVTEIYFYAFRYCSGLTGIYVDEDNPNYSSDDHGVLFNKDKTELIQVPGAITGSYAIPDSVSWMWEQAFAGCGNLTSVFIPDGVTYIDWNVFSDCTSLVDVYIPDSVTEIYADAFSGCTSLTSITIPASVTFIGNSVFSGCTNLGTICFLGNIPEMLEETFASVTATAYYPADNATWTANVMQNYGGNITWVAYDPNHTHEYTTEVTAPTCTEQGFTAYTCDCGDSYVTDFVDALGHEYVDGKCIRCGEEDPNYEKPVENPFDDVAPGSFFYEPVMWAIANGITNGTSATTFGPDDQCMRAHVVTFLWRAAGSPEPTKIDNPFVDVKPNDFYYKPVLWALEKGITSGMDATHFRPTSYCNRAQVVTFLYRTMGNPDVATSTNPFTDVSVGSFYEKPVLWAVENGITNGLSTTSFGPNSICNRAQIVTFLYRAFN